MVKTCYKYVSAAYVWVTCGALASFAAQEVEEAAMWKTIRWGDRHPQGLRLPPRLQPEALDAAYKRCGIITADYAKTFYLVRCKL